MIHILDGCTGWQDRFRGDNEEPTSPTDLKTTRDEMRLWRHTDGSPGVAVVDQQRGVLYAADSPGRGISRHEAWKLIMDAAVRLARNGGGFTEVFVGWHAGEAGEHRIGAFVPFSHASNIDAVRIATGKWHEALIWLGDAEGDAAEVRRDLIADIDLTPDAVETALNLAKIPFRYVWRNEAGETIIHHTNAEWSEISNALGAGASVLPVERLRGHFACVECGIQVDTDGIACRECEAAFLAEMRRGMEFLGNEPQSPATLCMVATMSGVVCRTPSHPTNPEEFGHCQKAMEYVPAWRARLYVMAEVSSAWASLLRVWNTVEAARVAGANTVSLIQDAVFWALQK